MKRAANNSRKTRGARASNNMGGRSGRLSSSSSTVGLVGGFPDRQRVTLRYVENVEVTPSGVTAVDYVFRGNGCFDPNVTSTGGQPANYDDFSSIYTRYRVHGSKISWAIANSASGTLDMCTYVVGPRHLSTAVTTLAGQANFQSTPYSRVEKFMIYTNGLPPIGKGSMEMSTQRFLGLSPTQFNGNDDLTALVTADPAHQWYWHFCVTVDDQSSSTKSFINFQIDYDIEFWDRVDTTLDSRYERVLMMRRMKALSDSKSKGREEVKNVDNFILVDSTAGQGTLRAPPCLSRDTSVSTISNVLSGSTDRAAHTRRLNDRA